MPCLLIMYRSIALMLHFEIFEVLDSSMMKYVFHSLLGKLRRAQITQLRILFHFTDGFGWILVGFLFLWIEKVWEHWGVGGRNLIHAISGLETFRASYLLHYSSSAEKRFKIWWGQSKNRLLPDSSLYLFRPKNGWDQSCLHFQEHMQISNCMC